LTGTGPGARRSGVRRLELKRVRVCSRCGRGRAELEGTDGERLEVVLDAPRARDLAGQRDDVRSLASFVLAQAAESQTTFGQVILDDGPVGLRALLSVTRAGESDVVACTAQEGVELAVRAGLAVYATEEALARETEAPRTTLH
jgi:hypothetical protein